MIIKKKDKFDPSNDKQNDWIHQESTNKTNNNFDGVWVMVLNWGKKNRISNEWNQNNG